MDADAIIAERETTHGEYNDDARAAMALVDAILLAEMEREDRKQDPLLDVQRHSLYLIAIKIGRILSGNPNLPDHWDDIAGYAKLVSDRLQHAPSTAKRTVLKEVEEPTGCADDCTHPSHRHGRPGRRADEQNETPMRKPPCACPLPGYCLAENSTPPKYAYCRKAENADQVADPFANAAGWYAALRAKTDRKVPRYDTPDLCDCARGLCSIEDRRGNPPGLCKRREWQKATDASNPTWAGTPSASPVAE